jgi:hypothetical protein
MKNMGTISGYRWANADLICAHVSLLPVLGKVISRHANSGIELRAFDLVYGEPEKLSLFSSARFLSFAL